MNCSFAEALDYYAPERYSMCLSKEKHETKEEAQKAVERCEKKYRKRLRFYECPLCEGYHLTKAS
jgi:hypothetical protein